MTAKTDVAALRALDIEKLERSEFGIESKLSSPQGGSLLALLGLDRAVAVSDGPLSVSGIGDGRVARAVAVEAQALG